MTASRDSTLVSHGDEEGQAMTEGQGLPCACGSGLDKATCSTLARVSHLVWERTSGLTPSTSTNRENMMTALTVGEAIDALTKFDRSLPIAHFYDGRGPLLGFITSGNTHDEIVLIAMHIGDGVVPIDFDPEGDRV